MMMVVVMAAGAMLVMVMVVMLMVVTAAALVLVMMVMMLVVVTAAALVLVMMVMVLVIVTAAALFLVMMVVMLMVMTAAALFLVMMVVMLVIVTAAAVLIMVVMVLMLQLCQLGSERCLTCHSGQDLLTSQFTPGGGNNRSLCIVLTEHSNSSVQLSLGNAVGTGHDDGGGRFHLIVIELTEVLHIDLDLTGIHNRHSIAQLHISTGDLLHSCHHIRQLAHTGGLDNNTVGRILGNDLLQRLAKIAHQTAADTAGVHLGDVDACILQEAAVNADLAKFILDQHQLLTCIGLLDHLLDQRGLTGTQKAGININFCHN
jgi:hypothetical protein